MKEYYKILELKDDCSQRDIKKSFYRLAHKYHPDKREGDVEKFKKINEAYQILSNPKKRKLYDEGELDWEMTYYFARS